METHMTFEELIEERRRTWSAPTYLGAREDGATPAGEAFERPEAFLEDTVPLSRYRPERL